MLKEYNLKMPHAVYGGENAIGNITAIIQNCRAKRVAMFTDKGIEGCGLFALPEEAVKASVPTTMCWMIFPQNLPIKQFKS